MSTVKKLKGLLFVSKEKIDCFNPATNQVVTLVFPPNVVRSMEVVDQSALSALIKTFIDANKILPTIFSVILNENILFEKHIISDPAPDPQAKIPSAQPSTQEKIVPQPVKPPVVEEKVLKQTRQQQLEEEENVVQQFLDTVPFDEVLHKTVKTTTEKVIYVVNKTLLMEIKTGFEQNGSTVDSIYPLSIFGKDIHAEAGFTPQVALLIIPRIDAMRSHNMLLEEKKAADIQTGPVAMGMPEKDSEKKRLYVMAGVFGILIIIMIVAFAKMNADNAALEQARQEKRAKATAVATPSATMTPIPTVIIPAASSSAQTKRSVPIELAVSSVRASLSGQLEIAMRNAGYLTITRSQGTINDSSLVIFSSSIPLDIRDELTALLMTYDPTTSVQENTEELPKVIISF